MKCSFPHAVVKGVIEHNDGAVYFGSLGGYLGYVSDARAAGWLTGPSHDPMVTDLGRAEYDRRKLGNLPRHGRAYLWNWKVTR